MWSADRDTRAAMAPEMIPMMIKQGYKAIAVAFDLWGLANLVNTGINKGREYAKAVAEEKQNSEAAIVNGNGKPAKS